MTRSAAHIRRVLTAAVLGAALLAVPAVAEASKVKITGGTVSVNDDGVAAIKLANPNGKAAKGTLALRQGLTPIGSRGYKIGARGKKSVKVSLSDAALQVLAKGDDVAATAYAKTKGKGTSRKSLRLTHPGGGGTSGGGTAGGGSTGGGSQPGSQQPAAQSIDGRWQGTYATNNADLAFNIQGNRLYTGPFDAFYLEANCESYSPDATAFEPIEATISPNGVFYGSGTYRPSASLSMPWTISGHITGRTLTGTFSSSYHSDFHGNCSGTTTFTAAWYGAYTL
jgi:hypothetical protein